MMDKQGKSDSKSVVGSIELSSLTQEQSLIVQKKMDALVKVRNLQKELADARAELTTIDRELLRIDLGAFTPEVFCW